MHEQETRPWKFAERGRDWFSTFLFSHDMMPRGCFCQAYFRQFSILRFSASVRVLRHQNVAMFVCRFSPFSFDFNFCSRKAISVSGFDQEFRTKFAPKTHNWAKVSGHVERASVANLKRSRDFPFENASILAKNLALDPIFERSSRAQTQIIFSSEWVHWECRKWALKSSTSGVEER